MPTKTGYWIRVKNGKVTDVWDYKPSAEKLASEVWLARGCGSACRILWPTARS
jgi:hypothetical protein